MYGLMFGRWGLPRVAMWDDAADIRRDSMVRSTHEHFLCLAFRYRLHTLFTAFHFGVDVVKCRVDVFAGPGFPHPEAPHIFDMHLRIDTCRHDSSSGLAERIKNVYHPFEGGGCLGECPLAPLGQQGGLTWGTHGHQGPSQGVVSFYFSGLRV